MPRFTLALVLACFACDDDTASELVADAAVESGAIEVRRAPETSPADRLFRFEVFAGAPGATVELAVLRGGGSVAVATLTADEEGLVEPEWRLGRAPVDNTLRIARVGEPESAIEHTLRATLDAPWPVQPFADVAGWMDAEGLEGSTEDLSFTADGLLLGIPGGVARVGADQTVTALDLSGEEVSRVWGFAVDADGALWAVDAENIRMVRIDPDGTVTEALAASDEVPLEAPNYVMVGHDGRVYLSDPCAGFIVRFDPSTGETATHLFDLATEGGPNGMAVGPDGALYTVTQNTGLLCNQPDIQIDADLAGVYRLDLDDFSARTPVTVGLGLIGDGLAFDAEGNLYVVVDRQENFMLTESAVRVIPAGGDEALPFLIAPERQLIANVAFGTSDYGEATLYMAMLHLPPFTDSSSRGLTRAEVGIPGQPLLP